VSGNSEAARKVAAEKLAIDPDHFKRIGAMGGRKSRGGGFTYMAIYAPDAHRMASAKGGRISRRGKTAEK
jgi:hypothetical protein